MNSKRKMEDYTVKTKPLRKTKRTNITDLHEGRVNTVEVRFKMNGREFQNNIPEYKVQYYTNKITKDGGIILSTVIVKNAALSKP